MRVVSRQWIGPVVATLVALPAARGRAQGTLGMPPGAPSIAASVRAALAPALRDAVAAAIAAAPTADPVPRGVLAGADPLPGDLVPVPAPGTRHDAVRDAALDESRATTTANAPDLWVMGATITNGVAGAPGYVTVRIENHGGAVSAAALLMVSVRRPGVSLAAAAAGPASRVPVPVVFAGGATTVRVPLPVAVAPDAPFCILTTVYMPGDPRLATGAQAAASP